MFFGAVIQCVFISISNCSLLAYKITVGFCVLTLYLAPSNLDALTQGLSEAHRSFGTLYTRGHDNLGTFSLPDFIASTLRFGFCEDMSLSYF